MNNKDKSKVASPNFAFLAKHNEVLVRYGAQAERYVFDDPNTALIKLRQFAELLAQQTAACTGVTVTEDDNQVDVLNSLWDARVVTGDVSSLFHDLRKAGNRAVHQHSGTRSEALHQLRMARTLAVWFHRAFGKDPHFKAGPFVPPPDPAQMENELAAELERLRQQVSEQQQQVEAVQAAAESETELRELAEQEAKTAYQELEAALELAQENEELLKTQFQEQLASAQELALAAPSETQQAVIQQVQQASEALDLDEQATRKLIDAQLVDAGWEVNSEILTYGKGVRPQKGKNLAIAEWPTTKGPADYVLFAGLTPVAVVEAKRKQKDVPAAIEQAKRYSEGYQLDGDQISPGGPWGKFAIPFLFATNGRPYLKQIKTKSGIWFLDGRASTNHPRALEGWYTPNGLTKLLKQDLAAADQRLKDEPSDYLPLREFQHEAVLAVEDAIAKGRRELLLAMATGTGKTRTCIGIIYRLIKSKRFNRVLFLVDRTALGEQATNAFKDVRLENHQSFSDIYDIKELSDIAPDSTTKLQVATIQGMVKRVLYAGDDSPVPPVDQYDCIVVDECHRGYNLDRDMSDAEFDFRSEADYISKYSRVLDHFDAVKIGLTATPALHTTEIFGGPDRSPVYQYSYRQAVIDGWLVDHEPPIRIVTQLAEEGIKWDKGEEMKVFDTGSTQMEFFNTPDEVEIEIDQFNRRVVTENFNKVVCTELAKHIDPSLPGKTLIFCATDFHADMVVDLLTAAFEDQYGPIDDDVVVKITGAADKPMEKIRRFRNESRPKVAVTVDLLTTGIDVPEIVNLVFIRRVRSRILYEQMMGRATRLCADLYDQNEDKDRFFIFDAVDLYAALESHTAMKPVVAQPNITVAQLIKELADLDDPDHLAQVHDQLIAKLQGKKRKLKGKRLGTFQNLTGSSPSEVVKQIKNMTPKDTAAWFADRDGLVDLLDQRTSGGVKILISEHDDELLRVERGYGTATKPEDYLESFRKYIEENKEQIAAIQTVCQRPRDLSRKELRELQLLLDTQGFSESHLRTAVRETTNHDIAATIIGHIRHVVLGLPLLPYEQRVNKAIQEILASRDWTNPQRKWLQRIGKQLEQDTIVDRDALDQGSFKEHGGFTRLNKIFDGKLEELLHEIADTVWKVAA